MPQPTPEPMADIYDFVILGSGPLSALLAGLLAHDHDKRVMRVAEPLAPQRLPRSIDIALPLATRPASWRVLRQSQREMLELMRSLEAPDAIAPTEVRIVADLPATATALAHMSHVAAGYGVGSRAGHFRNVLRLTREVSLRGSKVQNVPPDDLQVSFADSGTVELSLKGERLDAVQVVLADDASILAHLPEAQRPKPLTAVPTTVTLTAPTRRLSARVVRYPDRGVTVAQRPDFSVLALVSGAAEIEERLASCLPGPFPLQRRATGRFSRLMTSDGAPLIGRLEPSRLFVIAGLADAVAFFAPPIARLLAGKSTAEEEAWFAAHDPSAATRETIADFIAARELAA